MSETTSDTATKKRPFEYAGHLVGQGAITPTFRVVDIDAARGHLEGNGVRCDGETNEVPGMVRLATFYDPDGNPWMLAQVLQEAAE